MKITFDKYIDNPSGGSSVVTNRSMYKSLYTTKFNNVLVRENGKIKYTLYTEGGKLDKYYVYLKIPSEVISNFYYDVVIEFYTNDNKYKMEASLRHYYVKFYSNDPAFVYTFAHSFIKNELFINDLEPRMSREAIKNVAKMKNPKNEVWYVKSLYFAYLSLEKYNLFSKALYNNASKYNKKELLRQIIQAEDKVKQRQFEQEKLQKQKAKEKTEQKKNNKKPNIRNMDAAHIKTSNISKTTKVSKVSNITKYSKKTKRI